MASGEWRMANGDSFSIRYSLLTTRQLTHVSIFTYSKSPGLLSMPTLGGEIQEA